MPELSPLQTWREIQILFPRVVMLARAMPELSPLQTWREIQILFPRVVMLATSDVYYLIASDVSF